MQFTVKETPNSGAPIKNTKQCIERFKSLGQADQESFWVIGFDNHFNELLCTCCHLGGMESSVVDVRIIFKRLICAGATGFVVVHNHPGGDATPSKEDEAVTVKLKKGGDILDLQFLDHVIIASDDFYSFMAAENILEKNA